MSAKKPKVVNAAGPAIVQLTEYIWLMRGHRVILDVDLARLYEVSTRRLNEQIRRNPGRFPSDFVFALTNQEVRNLKSHFATSSWGGRRKVPLAFTEHGALQAAGVLNSDRATQVSVFLVRAFVRLRDLLAVNPSLGEHFIDLERKLAAHDEAIASILEAIRQFTTQPMDPKRSIGFTADIK